MQGLHKKKIQPNKNKKLKSHAITYIQKMAQRKIPRRRKQTTKIHRSNEHETNLELYQKPKKNIQKLKSTHKKGGRNSNAKHN